MMLSLLSRLRQQILSRRGGRAVATTFLSRKRHCRLEPLEDRRLLSVTGFQPPDASVWNTVGPKMAPAALNLPLHDKALLIDWAKVEVADSKDPLLRDVASTFTGDGITNYHAVIVGISNYPDTGSISDLGYSASDAQEIRDTLLTGINWRPENITLLKDSAATIDAMIVALQQMASMTDADDVCLFYYSGHGTQEADQAPFDEADSLDEVLVSYDYETNGGLSDDMLMTLMNSLATDNYLVILDCCQGSGGLATAAATPENLVSQSSIADGIAGDLFTTSNTATSGFTTKAYNPMQGIAITACAEGQLSSEADAIEHGVFTYNVLEGLQGWADANLDGWVSAEECFGFAGYNAVIQDPEAQPTIFDYYLGELPILQLASPMPEVIFYEDFSSETAITTDWTTGDVDGDENTWKWYEDETIFVMVYNSGATTVSPMDGIGSPVVDCAAYSNVFLRMDHSATSYADVQLDLDLIDGDEQRTTVWSETLADDYDLGAVVLDISSLAAGDSAISLEWWFMATVLPGQAANWELIDVELRGSDTKDIRVSVLDQGTENGGPVRARVDVLAAPLTDLVITLDSGDESEVTTPMTVTIPAGKTTAEFLLPIVDDTNHDGLQTVTITASAAGYVSGSDTIDILDDEPVRLAGDANLDGRVDGSDVTILAGSWQSTTATWNQGDFNGDGRVDGSDVTILAGNWQARLLT